MFVDNAVDMETKQHDTGTEDSDEKVKKRKDGGIDIDDDNNTHLHSDSDTGLLPSRDSLSRSCETARDFPVHRWRCTRSTMSTLN